MADAFDAITNNLPYRMVLGLKEAWGHFEEGGGTQCDGAVTEAFAWAATDNVIEIGEMTGQPRAGQASKQAADDDADAPRPFAGDRYASSHRADGVLPAWSSLMPVRGFVSEAIPRVEWSPEPILIFRNDVIDIFAEVSPHIKYESLDGSSKADHRGSR